MTKVPEAASPARDTPRLASWQRPRLAMVAALIGVVTFCAGVLMVVVTFRAYGAQDYLWAAVWLGAPLVGGVTAALRPRNAVGWLLLGVGIFGVGSQISYAYSPGRHLTDQAALKAMSRAEMLGHG